MENLSDNRKRPVSAFQLYNVPSSKAKKSKIKSSSVTLRQNILSDKRGSNSKSQPALQSKEASAGALRKTLKKKKKRKKGAKSNQAPSLDQSSTHQQEITHTNASDVKPTVIERQSKKNKIFLNGDVADSHVDESPPTPTNASNSHANVSGKSSNMSKMPSPEGDSEKDGRVLLEWLLHPFPIKKFFSEIWEKKPLLVRRHNASYAKGIFSSGELNRILHDCNVRFDVNLDVTTYQDGMRETHNVDGRAYAPVVWDYYNNGCSVRLKNPQAFSNSVWKLCSTMQEYFKSMVGANIYLTPPGTQGFAPHYDDIEAFVLQLEGRKHWTLYNPKSEQETLPRYSSKNFEPSEIGSEIFHTTLDPGDLLYFPRGFIHQARSLPDEHSLHITISTYQKNSWADLMELLVPAALKTAITESVAFRQGLPLDFLTTFGVQNAEKTGERCQAFQKQVASMFRRLADYADVDSAADVHAVKFLHDALPPVLSAQEKKRSVLGAKVNMCAPGRPSDCVCALERNSKVRVVRKNALRLCVNASTEDDSTVRVYHSGQNSRVYHEEEEKFFDIELECAPAVEYLINSYPQYVAVRSLPLDGNDDEKITLASSLLEKGLLLTEKEIQMTQIS